MRVKRQMRGGREEWTATCGERGCGHTETATDKGTAKSRMRTHDRKIHKPQRQAATRSLRNKRRQERQLGTKLDHEMSGSQFRAAYQQHQEELEIAEKRAARGKGKGQPISKSSGLRTKGIPGVPDGQKITGLVYDDNGKRVSWTTIQKYHNVD